MASRRSIDSVKKRGAKLTDASLRRHSKETILLSEFAKITTDTMMLEKYAPQNFHGILELRVLRLILRILPPVTVLLF